MSDDLTGTRAVSEGAPATSLAVAQAVLRAADGSLPQLVGVGRTAPAFLLPASPRVAAAVCRAYNGLRPTRRRWQRSVVALALQARLGALVGAAPADLGFTLEGMPAAGSLLDELSARLGTTVVAGVGLGSLDAYWKPVLQLFDATGAAVGFAKVGWTPMTRRLVDNEWAVLEHLDGRLDAPVVPRPLLRLDWGPLRVVVTAPLPSDSTRLDGTSTADVPAGMTDLDGSAEDELVELAWWAEVRAAVTEPVDGTAEPAMPDLLPLVDAVEGRHVGRRIPVGLVHGDWVPWNQARRASTGELVVWDWEYADLRAPLGLDEVHARYQIERLLHGRSDADAFAVVHSGIRPDLASLHACLVASRRCRARALGAADQATAAELRAATDALATAVSRAEADPS